jgi:hypothetical protein
MIDQAKLDAVTREVTRRLIDEGKIIEAGWVSMRALMIAKDAPPLQLDEMRMAFFAGAQHLFTSIMSVMEAGEEPTENDLRRMSSIHAELDTFIEDFKKRHNLRGGG